MKTKNPPKHGFYTAHFQPAERTDLHKREPQVEYTILQDEIELLRVFLRRTIERLNAEKDVSAEFQLRALDVVSKAAARLSHLMNVHYLIAGKLHAREKETAEPAPPWAQIFDQALHEAHQELGMDLAPSERACFHHPLSCKKRVGWPCSFIGACPREAEFQAASPGNVPASLPS